MSVDPLFTEDKPAIVAGGSSIFQISSIVGTCCIHGNINMSIGCTDTSRTSGVVQCSHYRGSNIISTQLLVTSRRIGWISDPDIQGIAAAQAGKAIGEIAR